MSSGNVGGSSQKQEVQAFGGNQRILTDQIKEDGIRKELYENERKARENWAWKWGFYKETKNLCREEAMKRGLDVDRKTSPSSGRSTRLPTVTLSPSPGVPQRSSGMIGWRSGRRENNLELLAGPMYVSRRVTMDPPPREGEADVRYQKTIFLG